MPVQVHTSLLNSAANINADSEYATGGRHWLVIHCPEMLQLSVMDHQGVAARVADLPSSQRDIHER